MACSCACHRTRGHLINRIATIGARLVEMPARTAAVAKAGGPDMGRKLHALCEEDIALREEREALQLEIGSRAA